MQQLRGSGKTAVLVERIINKIINENVDIDKLLVVTFTNAAAAEMRERILDAIYKQIEINPENSNLQRQITLLNKASICTIHSFCLDVIRNNFYEINISPNFKIGDTSEVELLKYDVLEELFESKYEEKNEEFIELINTYTNYRSDDSLKELILNIYNFIQSSPFPEEWIEEKVEEFNILNLEEDFGNTKWGKILLGEAKEIIDNSLRILEKSKKELGKFPEAFKFYSAIINDIEKLENLNKNLVSWENAYKAINELTFEKWPIDRKVNLDEKETAKEQRDKVKKEINKLKDTIFVCSSEEANKDILDMYPIFVALKNIILDFKKIFEEKKAEKNIIDFNDIEHLALKILVKKDEEGKIIPTDVAKKYTGKFSEIAIDEYQDSNLVQEYILSSISNGNNMFMVGDVKQSIYKFRQACPELFLEKYETYKKIDEFVGAGTVSAQKENIANDVGTGLVPAQENTKDSLKIQLFKNFRSRQNVLKYTNIIFENIMSKKLGDIDYTEEEFLNLGADYPESKEKEHNIELNIIDLNEEIEDDEENKEIIENIMVEAKLVAKRIKQLIDSKYQVYDRKQGFRDITYKDIVILLRSTSDKAEIYEKELSKLEIPVFSDSNESYLDTYEIQTIINLLKIIDNPMQDIPLVSVLRSPIAKFTDDELIKIRVGRENKTFYESLLQAEQEVEESLKNKLQAFLNMLEEFKEANEYLPLNELIWKIYEDTGYLNIVSIQKNGELKIANLKMLFEKAKAYEDASFKGLFNFILFIDKIKTSSGDMGSAKLVGENANVVRIMSIHKSKGLEFPVVFLSETGKKFNMQDLNESILMHQKLGFGPKRINYKKSIEYNTSAKEALKNVIKDETISEEMRVLYVALTRAKEKLIITGRMSNIAKSQKEKEELIEINNKELSPYVIKKYKTYLDWFMLVYLKNKEILNDILEINEYKIKDILKKEDIIEKEKLDIKNIITKHVNEEEVEKLKETFNWKYSKIDATNLISKTSVSDIKNEVDETYEKINVEPKFLAEEKVTLSSSEKGTLMHLILQKIDFKNRVNIKELLQELLKNNIIDELELKNVQVKKIESFLNSNLAKKIKNAKEIHKEEPFYINLKANEIYDTELEDKILVQGVMDLYFIDEEDRLVLVDYKTDYVKTEEELARKYEVQLRLYKRALENAKSKKVDEVYIYSTHLSKEIDVAKLCKL